MKIVTIMSRDLNKPSTKFRLVQYLSFLEENGIHMEFIHRKQIDTAAKLSIQQADLVINQKCATGRFFAYWLRKVARKIIFDFDDAIYTRPEDSGTFFTNLRQNWRLRYWFRKVDLVTTSSEYLANYARKYTQNVVVIPMAIDTKEWICRSTWDMENMSADSPITVGWAGSPSSVFMLEKIGTILEKLQQKYPQVKIAIYCGKRPSLPCTYEYHPFQPGNESAFVSTLDIGLLPLNRDEFSCGKSPIKTLQYLACQVPVVGNIWGATAEILSPEYSIKAATPDEWFLALERLILDRQLLKNMGQAGRLFVEKKHSHNVIGQHMLCTWHKVIV